MKILVLGGTGFVGRHVRDALHRAGHDVLSVSRGTGVDLMTADLAPVVDGCDVVVNAAGSVWLATEQQMLEANAALVDRLVKALSDQRFVQLGTVHEYGSGVAGRGTTETQPTVPLTPYGKSKLIGTTAALDSGRDVVVLRVSNVIGPGVPEGSLMRTVADHLASGSDEPLTFGSLRAWRDYVDARDVADAVLRAITAPVTGEVINIGSGAAVRTRTLVERMVALSGRGVAIVEDAAGGRADAEWLQLDIVKADRLLGWRPRRGLDESLRDLLAAA
ncbi:NAD-dependent epimerase/dehydratase family protein [Lentzea nigeriaca]|uniref:NAD-dependent epimerase/dehydratase family protein n=1 Tax=Lentzea nigeriaca TaxID=1128665 RepID=UPI00195DD100|nr:NAD(P)-dependent oxidoreductase [Lentzea nigeriaca]MBM7862186.1 nucleoside-diphosphate-sugar epimerase [Lentzea nigeriaca]